MISLDMVVEQLPDGRYSILAPWLAEPVTGETFHEAYWIVVATRPRATTHRT